MTEEKIEYWGLASGDVPAYEHPDDAVEYALDAMDSPLPATITIMGYRFDPEECEYDPRDGSFDAVPILGTETEIDVRRWIDRHAPHWWDTVEVND